MVKNSGITKTYTNYAVKHLLDTIEKQIARMEPVNFPNVSLDAAGKKTTVLHKADADLSGIAADAKATGTKGGFSYTILAGDVDAEAVKAIDGVIRVRVLA